MNEISALSAGTTSDIVRLALNASVARHNAIATNIANANNDNFQPVRIRFDEQLALIQERLVDRRYDASAGRLIDSLRESITPDVDTTADKVRLDVEVAAMVQNSVHYQALLTAKGKLTAIMRLAINGGR